MKHRVDANLPRVYVPKMENKVATIYGDFLSLSQKDRERVLVYVRRLAETGGGREQNHEPAAGPLVTDRTSQHEGPPGLTGCH